MMLDTLHTRRNGENVLKPKSTQLAASCLSPAPSAAVLQMLSRHQIQVHGT